MCTKLINNKKIIDLRIKFFREKYPEKKLFLFDPDPDQSETDPHFYSNTKVRTQDLDKKPNSSSKLKMGSWKVNKMT